MKRAIYDKPSKPRRFQLQSRHLRAGLIVDHLAAELKSYLRLFVIRGCPTFQDLPLPWRPRHSGKGADLHAASKSHYF